MPKGVRATPTELPASLKFEVVEGQPFVQLRQAAKLAGLHPVVLEMGQRLLKAPGTGGAVFKLATSELQKRAGDIETTFRAGLKRVAKAFGPGGLAVKSYREDDRLVFWFETAPGPGRRAARKG